MPLNVEGEVARLSGHCGSEDAAPLAEWLAGGGRHVRLDRVTHLHADVLAALVGGGPEIEAAPEAAPAAEG